MERWSGIESGERLTYYKIIMIQSTSCSDRRQRRGGGGGADLWRADIHYSHRAASHPKAGGPIFWSSTSSGTTYDITRHYMVHHISHSTPPPTAPIAGFITASSESYEKHTGPTSILKNWSSSPTSRNPMSTNGNLRGLSVWYVTFVDAHVDCFVCKGGKKGDVD